MKKKINRDFIAVNICVLFFGIPAIWVVGQVFGEPFAWENIFRILVDALLLVNISLLFKYFRDKKV